jgi:hypothetical protein
MKGIVFNLLEDAVIKYHGEDVWDDFLDAAELDGAYTSLGSYDDAELERLVLAASNALNLAPGTVLRWFGRVAMPNMAIRFPVFFQGHTTGRTFVMDLNAVVHAEVRKLYVGAGCPRFDLQEDGTAVLMGYHSPRRLCDLAHGFLEGLADHYGETVAVEHLYCRNAGDDRCLIRADWA